jgi:hypothetical protein
LKERHPPGIEGEPASPRILADRYELLEELAQGGFAVTHRARDRTTGEECVVKEVLYRKIEDPKVLDLLEREARVLAHLRHPRIPRFVEFFRHQVEGETRLFLVQGYVPGRSLAQWARDGRHFSEREVVGIGVQVARILAYLHELRPPIIHRDVKPGNVVLDPTGEAWLVDFGAVRDRILHEIRTEGEGATVVGTYGYMPFEQFQGRALPASDVYALGMTLVFLLAHKEPHEIEAVSGRFELEPHVHASHGLRRVIRRMIEPRPQDRYPSAAELCADLEALLRESPARPALPRLRMRFSAMVTMAALAALLGFGLLRRPPAPVAPTPAPRPQPAGNPVRTRPPDPFPRRANEQVLGFSIRGRLTYDGRPLEAITKKPADFWLRNEDRGDVQPAIVSYERGQFVARALPKARIGFQVVVNLNDANPSSYPGDLYRWKSFEVEPNPREPVEIDLWKIIRLRAPQDNGAPLPGWGEDCAQMFVADSPRFEWEAPEPGLSYAYEVERVQCPYKSQGKVAEGTTRETTLQVPLPPSAADEFYLFRLQAKRGERTLACITTHGLRGGLGWDYRFRLGGGSER